MTTDNRTLMRQALEALENSVDLVDNEYETAWRHKSSMPSRMAQLAGMKNLLDKHNAIIERLRDALQQPE